MRNLILVVPDGQDPIEIKSLDQLARELRNHKDDCTIVVAEMSIDPLNQKVVSERHFCEATVMPSSFKAS